MAKKLSIRYVCSNCGYTTGSWSGKCYSCGEWNTLVEEVNNVVSGGKRPSGKIITATSISSITASHEKRLKVGIKDVDNVLGGGFVEGSVCLVAGQPGIGKSTLLMQLAASVARNMSVLYVSAEESVEQVGQRAKRLKVGDTSLKLASSTSAEDIVSSIESKEYQLVIIDSIQTISSENLPSSSGSVTQITGCTQIVSEAAKAANVAVILVGHVTKEGNIAGPKILEHLVDVVLQLEGDRYGALKLLRAVKNRYGSTNEVGIFEMSETGLSQVTNPSQLLLSERLVSDGSIVLATMEGKRPLLVEVQALVNKTSYGYPKRASSGFDQNRLNLLIAMLEKRTKLRLSDQDIYINIVGGISIKEPAADLAIAIAIGSASRGLKLRQNAVVCGELGLLGEVRRVPDLDRRIDEAKSLGFDCLIGPSTGLKKPSSFLMPVVDVRTALNQFLEK